MKKILLLVYLLVLSYFDMKEKKIPVVLLAAGSALALGMKLWYFWGMEETPGWFLATVVLGSLPGAFMFAISRLTDQAGVGDGWVLLNLGLFTDYKTCIVLWGSSMLFMAVFCIGLLAFRKVKHHTRLPYLPFLALMYIVVLVKNYP